MSEIGLLIEVGIRRKVNTTQEQSFQHLGILDQGPLFGVMTRVRAGHIELATWDYLKILFKRDTISSNRSVHACKIDSSMNAKLGVSGFKTLDDLFSSFLM
jgi:hypothetical protein